MLSLAYVDAPTGTWVLLAAQLCFGVSSIDQPRGPICCRLIRSQIDLDTVPATRYSKRSFGDSCKPAEEEHEKKGTTSKPCNCTCRRQCYERLPAKDDDNIVTSGFSLVHKVALSYFSGGPFYDPRQSLPTPTPPKFFPQSALLAKKDGKKSLHSWAMTKVVHQLGKRVRSAQFALFPTALYSTQ